MKRDLAALAARERDLLVIGGGFSGAAVLREAACAGLDAILVDARDFGSGASWHSLRTVHGGLRHLQRADVAGLRESMAERRAFLRTAPWAVRPLGFLVPAANAGRLAFLATGVKAAEWLCPDRNRGLPQADALPASQVLDGESVERVVPGLSGASGGVLWWDAQAVHAERLVLSMLVDAVEQGAACANHVAAESLLVRDGAIRGARLRDALTGDGFEVAARAVVVAANEGAAPLLAASGLAAAPAPWLVALNLVLGRDLGLVHAVGARARGRFLFAAPWAGGTLIGTDYAPRDAGGPDPLAFLDVAREAFPWAQIAAGDVAYHHRGFVPGESASRLWTHHRLESPCPGLHVLTAAKFTTARAAAAEAVDAVLASARRPGRPRGTEARPLPDLTASPDPATAARDGVERLMARTVADVVLRRLPLGPRQPAEAAILAAEAALAAAGVSPDAAGAGRAGLARELGEPGG
ncbi:MAG: FAD-dependent oxidoreductase [Vicinamibacteria bacterium]|nr:FAD-dependent oxidoreductase [Vicinamibacteria bacterium]